MADVLTGRWWELLGADDWSDEDRAIDGLNPSAVVNARKRDVAGGAGAGGVRSFPMGRLKSDDVCVASSPSTKVLNPQQNRFNFAVEGPLCSDMRGVTAERGLHGALQGFKPAAAGSARRLARQVSSKTIFTTMVGTRIDRVPTIVVSIVLPEKCIAPLLAILFIASYRTELHAQLL